MKIAFFSTQSYDKIYFNEVNVQYGYELVYFDAQLNDRSAVLAEGCDAVCIFVNDKADAATMEKLIQLGIRNMVLRCAGFNQVDLDAAKRLGMNILRVPAYSPEAVAEHAVALILTLNRKTHKAYNRVREGNFSLDRLTGFNLHGKTVGTIGLGKIGKAFARIMHGFGCKVIAYDPYEVNVADYIQLVPLDELFDRSDIASIHCPLTPENKHLF